jgi:hypothetical protein
VEIATLERGEKKKAVDQVVTVNCLFCGAKLQCPPEASPWFWLKCGDVVDFFAEHRSHGFPNLVGAEVHYIEKD